MARSTWSLLIGVLSTFMYTSLTLFNVVYLLYLCGYIELQDTEDKTDVGDASTRNSESFHSATNIYITVSAVIVFMAMIVVSILLQVGVKRERHQLLYPWLCLSGFVLVLGGIGFVFSQSYFNVEFILDVLIILLQAAMWFPIYVHYQQMRQRERLHIENCNRQRNGAAYYMGRTSDSVYAPTTEFINTNTWSATLPHQIP